MGHYRLMYHHIRFSGNDKVFGYFSSLPIFFTNYSKKSFPKCEREERTVSVSVQSREFGFFETIPVTVRIGTNPI